jgi:hypothetical protein
MPIRLVFCALRDVDTVMYHQEWLESCAHMYLHNWLLSWVLCALYTVTGIMAR